MKFIFLLFLALHLQGLEVLIDQQSLEVEVADTPHLREQGLMGRDQLEDGKGMLFVFEEPQFVSFWMKNTKIPLSIAFFDAKGNFINQADMVPEELHPLMSYKSAALALYAVEVPWGWYKSHKIGYGSKLSFPLHEK